MRVSPVIMAPDVMLKATNDQLGATETDSCKCNALKSTELLTILRKNLNIPDHSDLKKICVVKTDVILFCSRGFPG